MITEIWREEREQIGEASVLEKGKYERLLRSSNPHLILCWLHVCVVEERLWVKAKHGGLRGGFNFSLHRLFSRREGLWGRLAARPPGESMLWAGRARDQCGGQDTLVSLTSRFLAARCSLCALVESELRITRRRRRKKKQPALYVRR